MCATYALEPHTLPADFSTEIGKLKNLNVVKWSHLTASNGDCRGWGESGNDWQWKEIDEESETKKSCDEDYDAGEEGEEDGVLGPVVGDLCRHQSHDGRRANIDVFLTAITGFTQTNICKA